MKVAHVPGHHDCYDGGYVRSLYSAMTGRTVVTLAAHLGYDGQYSSHQGSNDRGGACPVDLDHGEA